MSSVEGSAKSGSAALSGKAAALSAASKLKPLRPAAVRLLKVSMRLAGDTGPESDDEGKNKNTKNKAVANAKGKLALKSKNGKTKGGEESKSEAVSRTHVIVRDLMDAMREMQLQPTTVQARLFWLLDKLHAQETMGMGNKKDHSAKVKVVDMPSIFDAEELASLATRIHTPASLSPSSSSSTTTSSSSSSSDTPRKPDLQTLQKLPQHVRVYFGEEVKPKLVFPAKSAKGTLQSVEHGQPFLVVVAPTTERCQLLYKKLKKIGTPQNRILKLYSHATQVDAQVKSLGDDVRVVVGTPARLARLAQLKALSFARTELFVIDCAKDLKQMSILTMNIVRDDLMRLWNEYMKIRVVGDGFEATPDAKMMFY